MVVWDMVSLVISIAILGLKLMAGSWVTGWSKSSKSGMTIRPERRRKFERQGTALTLQRLQLGD
jgi:hypothetical protein